MNTKLVSRKRLNTNPTICVNNIRHPLRRRKLNKRAYKSFSCLFCQDYMRV